MTPEKTDLLRGTLDMLILTTLTLQPMHGLGLARRIEQVTEGTFQVKPGSLFPALHRMEQKGWIKGEWGKSENKRRAKSCQRMLVASTRWMDSQLWPSPSDI